MRCKVYRRKNILEPNFPTYNMFNEVGNKFILSARKKLLSKTSNYAISTSQEVISKDSDHYVAKMKYFSTNLEPILLGQTLRSAICGPQTSPRILFGQLMYHALTQDEKSFASRASNCYSCGPYRFGRSNISLQSANAPLISKETSNQEMQTSLCF